MGTSLKNPPASACQGHQGCGIRVHCAFQAIRLFFYVFRTPKYHHDLPHQIPDSRFVFTPKIGRFLSWFSRPRKSEKQLPRPPTNYKKPSRNSFKTMSMKVDFCNTMRKRRFGSSKRRKFESEIAKHITMKILIFLKHFEPPKLT